MPDTPASAGMKPSDIPGMIEPVEQALLTELAATTHLRPGEVVCEFGAYFGRSTRCLAQGLLSNRSLGIRDYPVLRTYDVFKCDEGGMLGGYVIQSAQRGGVAPLLDRRGATIDFTAVFDHYMAGLPAGLMARHKTDLGAAQHTGHVIALMHVDAPKWYGEYRQVLKEFGPSLRVGSHVVFQDFFYQWSSTIVVAIHLLVEAGYFEPRESAASSLLVQVVKPLTAAVLEEAHERYQACDPFAVVQRVLKFYEGFDGLDRPATFVPRVALAAAQLAFESGDFQQSRVWLDTVCRPYGGSLPAPLARDLADLVAHGFSMRRYYETDLKSARSDHAASGGP